MHSRIIAGIVALWGGTMLLQFYRRVRSEGDDTITWIARLIAAKRAGANASPGALPTKRQFSVARVGIRVPGFGTFGLDQSEAEEAARVVRSLTEATKLKLNLQDPQGVQQAIRQLELDIDARIAPYRHNKMVVEFATKLKTEYRQVIQKQMEKLALSTSKRK